MLLILSSFCVQKGLMSTFCFSAFPTFCNDAVLLCPKRINVHFLLFCFSYFLQ